MRKTLIGAVSATALVASSLAGAATAATRVDGDHFGASGLRVVSQGCLFAGEEPATAPPFRIARGPESPPIGDRSVGWVPESAGGFGVGPVTHVDNPSSLTVLGISVYAPGGQDSGQAVVSYVAPDTEGVWKGTSPQFPGASTGWHAVNVETDSDTFSWLHYTDGVADQAAPNNTIGAFITSHGGDGTGAWVGFVYGCDGSPFFVDALQVDTNTGSRILDFQGFATRTSLLVDKKVHRKVTMTFGKSVEIKVRLREKVGGTPLAGRLRIDSRLLSARKWRHDWRKVGARGVASFKVHPNRSMAFRASYAGTTAREHSRSEVLKVRVRKKVNAGLVDARVTKGHAVTATGRVFPSRSSRVVLQRYVNKHWRTMRKDTTDGQGRYRLSAISRSAGISYWRVFAPAGGGNIGGGSPAMKLRTSPPPTGGGGGNPPTDPTDPPPPPPPPPPGPQRAWVG